MKRFLSLILATALLFSMATVFISAEESGVSLNTLASVTVNVGSFDTVEVGDKVFANRTYTFGENIPCRQDLFKNKSCGCSNRYCYD